MRTLGTLAVFCIVSFLGALVLVDAEEPESIADKSRDALVVSLCADVRMLIEKIEIPETDRATAYEIRASLISDMPLKTIEEMKKDNSTAGGQAWIIDEMYKRGLKKSIEEAFSRSHKANSPPPTVTPSLAHDLYRLTLLRGIFRRAQIRSKALDVLFDHVIMKIEMTSSA